MVQAGLEGVAVRTQEDAAVTCRSVFPAGDVASGRERINLDLVLAAFANGVYILHFVLTYL